MSIPEMVRYHSLLGIHLCKITNRVVQMVRSGNINRLLGFHGSRHDGMVGLQSIDVVLILRKHFFLNALVFRKYQWGKEAG